MSMSTPLDAESVPSPGPRDQATGGPRSGRRGPGRQSGAAGWLFCTPALALLGAFLVVPFLLAIWFSLTNQRLITPLPTRFVGLENYLDLAGDPEFRRAVINNVLFVAFVVPVQTGLALVLAVAVNQRLRGMVVYRTIFFAPVVTVMAVAATLWKVFYQPDTGTANAIIGVFGLQSDWLNSPTMALPAIALMSIWQGVGFQMIIVLAALQSVPQERYDAAHVDGAGPWQTFRDITVPSIRSTLIFVATITTILAFRLFDQVYVMTGGGPKDATETMLLQLVEVGFGRQRIGLASAIAVVFFVLVLVLTLIGQWIANRGREAA